MFAYHLVLGLPRFRTRCGERFLSREACRCQGRRWDKITGVLSDFSRVAFITHSGDLASDSWKLYSSAAGLVTITTVLQSCNGTKRSLDQLSRAMPASLGCNEHVGFISGVFEGHTDVNTFHVFHVLCKGLDRCPWMRDCGILERGEFYGGLSFRNVDSCCRQSCIHKIQCVLSDS